MVERTSDSVPSSSVYPRCLYECAMKLQVSALNTQEEEVATAVEGARCGTTGRAPHLEYCNDRIRSTPREKVETTPDLTPTSNMEQLHIKSAHPLNCSSLLDPSADALASITILSFLGAGVGAGVGAATTIGTGYGTNCAAAAAAAPAAARRSRTSRTATAAAAAAAAAAPRRTAGASRRRAGAAAAAWSSRRQAPEVPAPLLEAREAAPCARSSGEAPELHRALGSVRVARMGQAWHRMEPRRDAPEDALRRELRSPSAPALQPHMVFARAAPQLGLQWVADMVQAPRPLQGATPYLVSPRALPVTVHRDIRGCRSVHVEVVHLCQIHKANEMLRDALVGYSPAENQKYL
ncbi:hypothetical protein PRIPAC_87365 [Pristionchus pacificus]|uniref:Uncharacterized protein n=1 Tax=Pristionchus pacificus TaxID=54126 RepID=A0A2A6CT27_PRIPA|nr:hypothetical protein PRIPAC_87365 [Pristionchus pacificus]|eukprot:PDM81372.1 hypothetical protein PRIPAC_35248 [Pristionchus pacificus]